MILGKGGSAASGTTRGGASSSCSMVSAILPETLCFDWIVEITVNTYHSHSSPHTSTHKRANSCFRCLCIQSFFVLYESASGYALMEVNEAEEVGSLLEEVQQAVLDPQRFCRTVKLKGFQPFTTAENALENVNAISEQMVTDDLKVSERQWTDINALELAYREPT